MLNITLDLAITDTETNELLAERIKPEFVIKPDLVLPENVRKVSAYKKLNYLEQKETFRTQLLSKLKSVWQTGFSNKKAESLLVYLDKLISEIDSTGAAIFADMISRECFRALVADYDDLLENQGNDSWIHSYVNLANHPEFLSNENFNQAFLHPLLILLISYQVGGPIRLVDARAKDAKPLSVKAQDNMPHIDNTPFNDEYKIIVKWERGKVSGPKGQDFVIIPGTHKAVRNCFIDDITGLAWSTEDASIFITPKSVQNLFDIQKEVLKNDYPLVVKVRDDNSPLTTAFAAGSLGHHRHRTNNGAERSCLILAFHRASDNPGQFLDNCHTKDFCTDDNLYGHLFNQNDGSDPGAFIDALVYFAMPLANKLEDIYANIYADKFTTRLIPQESKEIHDFELAQWKQTVTNAPTVEDLKKREFNYPLAKKLPEVKYFEFLVTSMVYDKHGPLDLILYEDAHEEIRKWARNRIREMHQDKISERLASWQPYFDQVVLDDLLPADDIAMVGLRLKNIIDSIPVDLKLQAELGVIEKINALDAFRSLNQLIIDLGESIVRCASRQAFLSTSLFLFWTVDELLQILPEGDYTEILVQTGTQLLQNYVATSVLIQKQIQLESQPSQFAAIELAKYPSLKIKSKANNKKEISTVNSQRY